MTVFDIKQLHVPFPLIENYDCISIPVTSYVMLYDLRDK